MLLVPVSFSRYKFLFLDIGVCMEACRREILFFADKIASNQRDNSTETN